jgi:hypothetical protein
MRAYFIAQPRDAARFLLAAASLLELMWVGLFNLQGSRKNRQAVSRIYDLPVAVYDSLSWFGD